MTEAESDQKGIYEFADGGKYVGEWKDELANGYGVCIGPFDGGTFEGEWYQGSQSSGVFSCEGQRYSGGWQNGMRHGLGKEVRSDGAEYIGEFTENCRGTYGVLKLPNEAIYQGTWNNGLQDGVGMELYADKGVYKGQYKRGLRHGFGTRSSAMFEVSSKKKVSKSPHTTERIDEERPMEALVRRSVSQNLKVRRPKKLYQQHSSASSMLPGAEHSPSSSLVQSRSQSTAVAPTADSVNQIYEGQWENDRRQGYGVLKVPGRFTYCGEWLNNAKTGHGVMFYTDGRREEGYWTNGRLVTQLKHKKLSLKHHQLESKVNQAHTQALQAADTSRTKAILAESRASGASSRAKMAEKVIVAAEVNAEKARNVVASINGLEGTKTRTSTGTTPLVEMKPFPSLDADTTKSLDVTKSLSESSSSSSLFVPHIPSSASFESLMEADEDEVTVDGLSLSTGYLDKKHWDTRLQNVQDVQSSHSSLSSSHSHDDSRPAIQVNATDSPTTNRKSKTLPHSSSLRQYLVKQDSIHLSSPETPEERLPMAEPEDLPLMIKIPEWQNVSMRRRKKSIPRVNNSTGEVITVSADGSEDEQGTPTKPTPKTPIPAAADALPSTSAQVLQQQQVVTMDILHQMAKRNKTVEAINMFLMVCIILLLAVIVGVFTFTVGVNRPSGFGGPMA